MITSYYRLKQYLRDDSTNYAHETKWISRLKGIFSTNTINDQRFIWMYIKELRYNELYFNKSLLFNKLSFVALLYTVLLCKSNIKLKRLGYRTGYQIPPNTVGAGLTIWHFGYIIINENARIGRNLTIYPGVEIGHKEAGGGCPIIGDDCFIGAGAKIFGNIKIGNNVTIAANAIVTKDIPDNVVVGGIPAKIIKYKNEGPTD